MLLLSLVVFYIFVGFGKCVTVCNSFLGYYTTQGCHENLDSERNVTEIIRNWGATAEEYNITTIDGYQILVVRAYRNITQPAPIIIGHGINANSLIFVSTFNKSLAFEAIRTGFQIFLINYRGSTYSVVANNLTQKDAEYWNFSFQEMGIYDLPAVTEFVYNMTGSKAFYVGFSQGTAVSYIYGSLNSTHAFKTLSGIISLAPATTLKNAKSIMRPMAHIWLLFKPVFVYLWNNEFWPAYKSLKRFCATCPLTMLICENLFWIPLYGGFDYEEIDPLYRPVTEILDPDIMGSGLFTHWAQMILSENFQFYDHGPARNLELYGRTTPPNYNLTNIPVKVALFVGPNDWVTSQEAVTELYEALPKNVQCGISYIKWRKFNHIDFVTASHVLEYVNRPVLKKIQSMHHNICT